MQAHAHKEMQNIPWETVSARHFWRSSKQCRDRWLHKLNPALEKSDWCPREITTIYRMYMIDHHSPSVVARSFPSRSPQSVRNLCYAFKYGRRNRPKETAETMTPIQSLSKTQQQQQQQQHIQKSHSNEPVRHRNVQQATQTQNNPIDFMRAFIHTYMDASLYQEFHSQIRWFVQMTAQIVRYVPTVIWDCLNEVDSFSLREYFFKRVLHTKGYEDALEAPQEKTLCFVGCMADMIAMTYRWCAWKWRWQSPASTEDSHIKSVDSANNACKNPTCVVSFFLARSTHWYFLPKTEQTELACTHP
jgi:hypothetical protein